MKKTAQLKQLLTSPRLEFLMEAHDALSARIVEQAGFPGIWGSGLALSASHGVRDNNELSWTQVLEAMEFMSDATSIPILLDGDTGYGNFNNLRRLVRKLEQRQVAGVCIEDKLFPKTNSFLRAGRQPLADMDEFCGKIRAGKDSRTDEDFCIVARTEAFIAGWGLAEALRRAEAYHAAGADALLIHSKLSRPDEIVSFLRSWDGRCPVVIVPTKYYTTPTDVFRQNGVSVVIWANHLLRSSISAMQSTATTVYASGSLLDVEDRIAPLAEVFRLQDDEELEQAERKYLCENSDGDIRAIILAASRGEELGELTTDLPKCMLPVNGRPILEQFVDALRGQGVRDIAVVRGHRSGAIRYPDLTYYENTRFAETGELASLLLARPHLRGSCIISYGDILIRRHILQTLAADPSDIVIVVDGGDHHRNGGRRADLVRCTRPYTTAYEEEPVLLREMWFGDPSAVGDGEWIGLLKTSPRGSTMLCETLDALRATCDLDRCSMTDLFRALLEREAEVRVLYTDGHWLDIDSLRDLPLAHEYPTTTRTS